MKLGRLGNCQIKKKYEWLFLINSFNANNNLYSKLF